MTDHDVLIARLTADLKPVRRTAPAWARGIAATLIALCLGCWTTMQMRREALDWSGPLGWSAGANILLCLALGLSFFIAALTSGIAGRAARVQPWALGALAIWLAFAAIGVVASPSPMGTARDGAYCFTFVIAAGLPMSAIAILALRSTRSPRPVRSLALAAAGIGFSAFGLLAFCHPVTMSVVDFAGHLAAAAVLGGLTIAIGRPLVSIPRNPGAL